MRCNNKSDCTLKTAEMVSVVIITLRHISPRQGKLCIFETFVFEVLSRKCLKHSAGQAAFVEGEAESTLHIEDLSSLFLFRLLFSLRLLVILFKLSLGYICIGGKINL